MSTLLFLHSLFRRMGKFRFGFLDLLLILLGVWLAYWLIPGPIESLGS